MVEGTGSDATLPPRTGPCHCRSLPRGRILPSPRPGRRGKEAVLSRQSWKYLAETFFRSQTPTWVGLQAHQDRGSGPHWVLKARWGRPAETPAGRFMATGRLPPAADPGAALQSQPLHVKEEDGAIWRAIPLLWVHLQSLEDLPRQGRLQPNWDLARYGEGCTPPIPRKLGRPNPLYSIFRHRFGCWEAKNVCILAKKPSNFH